MPIEQGFEERIVTSRTLGEDSDVEYSLRPKILAEYIGQSKVKSILSRGRKRLKEHLEKEGFSV